MGILQPILIGIVIAYLINPVVRWEEKYLLRFLSTHMKNRIVDFFENWVETDLLPQTTNILASLTTGVISAVKVLLNVIIGVIISVYILMSKETFTGQAKKLVYALLPAAGCLGLSAYCWACRYLPQSIIWYVRQWHIFCGEKGCRSRRRLIRK